VFGVGILLSFFYLATRVLSLALKRIQTQQLKQRFTYGITGGIASAAGHATPLLWAQLLTLLQLNPRDFSVAAHGD